MKRWSLGGRLSLRSWSRSERLTLYGLVISFASLVVSVIVGFGLNTRTATAPVREETVDASAAQALLTGSANEVAAKGAELAEADRAARAAEAARAEEEAARPPVEVAKVSRKARSSRKRVEAPSVIYDGYAPLTGYVGGRRGVAGYDQAGRYSAGSPLGYSDTYATHGAPAYADIGGPVGSQRRTYGDGGNRLFAPPPAPRPEPKGFVAKAFRYIDDLGFPENLFVYGWLVYLFFGLLSVMKAFIEGVIAPGVRAKS